MVEPVVQERDAQPYVAVKGLVTMQTIPEIADRLGEVFGWLAGQGVEPAGPPFLKYNVIDMERELEIEAGVPVATEVSGDGPVFSGVLPAGRYATVVHRGHFDQLVRVTGALLDWAAKQGLEWDVRDTDRGQQWGCRLEVYHTDPSEEPDPSNWETELAFRLR